jgi:hypothetical protein
MHLYVEAYMLKVISTLSTTCIGAITEVTVKSPAIGAWIKIYGLQQNSREE